MKFLLSTACAAAVLAMTQVSVEAMAQTAPIQLPTGQSITPTAAPGAVFQMLNPMLPSSPTYTVGQAQTTAISPDGKTLLILTSGYNDDPDPATQTEFVFVFDISTGAPVQLQALPVKNAFCGVAWAANGQAFYVGGGQDDSVHTFTKTGSLWAESGSPIVFGHIFFYPGIPAGNGLFSYPGLGAATSPLAAGLATTADSGKLIVANLENDSISVVNTATHTFTNLDLRPGRNGGTPGTPGGEFPFWVTVKGNSTAYVSSLRDREIVVVNLAGATPTITTRIPVKGNPNRMVMNAAGTRLYVTSDNSDLLTVINPVKNKIIAEFDTLPRSLIKKPDEPHNGNVPNSVALSPDETTVYVTNAGTNSVSVIDVTGTVPVFKGMIPTGWYPNSVSVSPDGAKLYIVNGKSPTGPITYADPENYDEEKLKAGFLTMPVPGAADLANLTAQVAQNNGFDIPESANDVKVMKFLRQHIQHVIYIVKENRTYDQILGDLPIGNGDASLTEYGQALTPNFHAIAGGFVDLDNFYDSGEISMNGWQWSTTGRGNDLNEKIGPVNYGKGGGSYDSEGLSRDINVGLATRLERVESDSAYGLEAYNDPDLLPGAVNVVAPDGPEGEQGAGFIWSAALRAGLSVRNYGFLIDLVPYSAPSTLGGIAPTCYPYSTGTKQATAAEASLIPLTDPYFRGFDNALPDYCRYVEWAREFDQFVAGNDLPAFETVRFMHDHTGNLGIGPGSAILGVNTVDLQQADNDYAVGLLVDHLAHSPYASNTLVFVVEDDSQAGQDHVDSHRSTAYIVGPYVKQGGVVVSTYYTTVNLLRTMEDILGVQHLSLHDAHVAPMSDVFNIAQSPNWTYSATPAAALLTTQLPIPTTPTARHAALESYKPLHDAAWWGRKTARFRFDHEDENDEEAYNRVLWEGAMGDRPYPTERSGLDLRLNRTAYLMNFKAATHD
jgi:YVTN family beta-propeller protein